MDHSKLHTFKTVTQFVITALLRQCYHSFTEVDIFDGTEKENIAHLLASMHLAVFESAVAERKSGKFRHVTNTTFERFVEL